MVVGKIEISEKKDCIQHICTVLDQNTKEQCVVKAIEEKEHWTICITKKEEKEEIYLETAIRMLVNAAFESGQKKVWIKGCQLGHKKELISKIGFVIDALTEENYVITPSFFYQKCK